MDGHQQPTAVELQTGTPAAAPDSEAAHDGDRAASPASTPQGVRWWKKYPRVATALIGYAIVAVAILGYVVATHSSPWFGLPATSQALAITFAVSLAAPIALPFVWERLSKVAVFNFAIELTTITAQPNNNLTSALEGTDPNKLTSYLDAILPRIKQAVAQGERTELLQVDLGTGNNWWSTRLYLVAALADDYTRVRDIVFVERQGVQDHCFVGLAAPVAVRQALAEAFPELEYGYRLAYHQALQAQGQGTAQGGTPPTRATVTPPQNMRPPDPVPPDEVSAVTEGYSTYLRTLARGTGESGVKTDVTSESLRQWLGLDAPTVSWDGGPNTPSLESKILEHRTARYVALVQDGQLRMMVNREKLASRISDLALCQAQAQTGGGK